jgi:hypothetical protein
LATLHTWFSHQDRSKADQAFLVIQARGFVKEPDRQPCKVAKVEDPVATRRRSSIIPIEGQDQPF